MEQSGWRSLNESSVPLELEQMRNTIDRLDETIAALLVQRFSLSCQIGELKATAGMAVKDSQREQTVVENVKANAGSPQFAQALENVYTTIIKESCAVQAGPQTNTDVGETPPDLRGSGARGSSACMRSMPQCVQRLQCAPSGKRASGQSKRLYFPKVLIIGLGLIGGSLARQIKRRMPSTMIMGLDGQVVVEQARTQGIIDSTVDDLQDAVSKASLILLCATPSENLRLLEQIAPISKRRQVIMDVTSTKEAICQRADASRIKADFVGGHPLFGSHKHGLQASEELDVEGQRFCLVPSRKTSELTLLRLSRWLSDVGLRVVEASAKQHDQTMAATSHAIQLTAVAIGNVLAKGRSDKQLLQVLQLSGTGLRSFARLMASPADLWLDIIELNKANTIDALDSLIHELQQTRVLISCEDLSGLRPRFTEALRVHDSLGKLD